MDFIIRLVFISAIFLEGCPNIVGTPPSPPLLKGGGWLDLPKIESLPGVPKILLERGDNPEKRGVSVEMGCMPLFYYFTVQLHLLCVGVKVKFPLLHFDTSVF